MDNAIINMKLTPQEAVLIENIRASATLFGGTGNTSTATQHKTEVQIGQELMDKYMAMDDYDFIHEYAEVVGDDTILAVLQDTLGTARKWEVIFDSIDEDVIDELFEAYVSFEDRRQLFLDSQDREELAVQLVDLTMDGSWTPEN
jgi:hypothetical protein